MSVLDLEEGRARHQVSTPDARPRDTKGTTTGPRPARSARPSRSRTSSLRHATAATPGTPAGPDPRTGRSQTRRSRACAASLPDTVRPAPTGAAGGVSWRITDRGIALVLLTVAMIAVAALAVIIPTALRVTGDNYQPLGTSQLAQQ